MKYIIALLMIIVLTLSGCRGGSSILPKQSNSEKLTNISSVIEDNNKTLTTTTNVIKEETNQIVNITPTELKPTIEPHTTKILQQTVIQEQIVASFNKVINNLKDAIKNNNQLEKLYQQEQAARKKAEESSAKEFKNKIMGWSTICFFGMLVSGGLAIFLKGNKTAAGISIMLGLGLAICVFLVQTISLIPWIIGGLLVILSIVFVYSHFFNKKVLNKLDIANVELVKTVEATKPFMPPNNRKHFFGDGPLPGVIDNIQKSNTTKAIVEDIRASEDFIKAPSITPSVFIDKNGDGIDDNTGEIIPK